MTALAQKTDAHDQFSRVFPTECGLDLCFSVQVRVGEKDDGRNWKSCTINNETGVINIPAAHLWGSVGSVGQAMRRKDSLVTALRASIRFIRSSERQVLVTQRPGNANYEVLRYDLAERKDNLCVYRLPSTEVRFAKRNQMLQAAENRGPLAVMTANNRHEGFGSNRTDIWIVNKTGLIQLVQLIILTDDDGKTFRLVALNRWAGNVHRLSAPSPYPAEMHEDIFQNPEVRELAEQVVFVPKDAHPGFDIRAHVLQLPTFRHCILRNLETLPAADGKKRNYPVRRNVSFSMGGGGGIVSFYAPDMGCGGWGLVEQPQEDGPPKKFQIRQSLISPYGIIDGQKSDLRTDDGILDIQMGDIVTWTRVQDMGPDHPALILDAEIAYAA